VLAKFFAEEEKARGRLESAFPGYFVRWDEKKKIRALRAEKPTECAALFVKYVRTFVDRNRRGLTLTQVGNLHRIGAEVTSELVWHVNLLEAYSWHRLTKDRQNNSFVAERSDLAAGHLLIVIDWKENITLPQAHVETGGMFWTSERMPVACFGAAIYERTTDDSPVEVSYCVVLDHTCVASGVMLGRVLHCVRCPEKVKHASIWADCATHFMAVEFIGIAEHLLTERFHCVIPTCRQPSCHASDGEGRPEISILSCRGSWPLVCGDRSTDDCARNADGAVLILPAWTVVHPDYSIMR